MLLKTFQNSLFYLILLLPINLVAKPLFDAHLHYNEEDAKHFTAEQIINKLRQNEIKQAIVTSRPPSLVNKLHQIAPELIVPILGIYKNHEDKANWPQD
ncbi:MAG: hypothetical protein OEY36_13860, partial [Gammaproteobacteria bacterium]|nr:hypothetical protein [Gammaproteobacteria bacterium]